MAQSSILQKEKTKSIWVQRSQRLTVGVQESRAVMDNLDKLSSKLQIEISDLAAFKDISRDIGLPREACCVHSISNEALPFEFFLSITSLMRVVACGVMEIEIVSALLKFKSSELTELGVACFIF